MAKTTHLALRYPGPRPFSREDEAIFRGRDTEIAELLERIQLQQHLLIYSKSGIGKSSLLNAGVLPRLEQNSECFKFSFGAYNKDYPRPPLGILIDQLKAKDHPDQLTYLDKLIYAEGSLWYQLKRLQAFQPQKMSAEEKSSTHKRVIIIFDQFEELFTYPKDDIDLFKQALAEVLFAQIPANFRDAIGAALRAQPPAERPEKMRGGRRDDLGYWGYQEGYLEGSTDNGQHILDETELQLLHQPLDLKLVFAIRSDRMAMLNALTDSIPELLKVFYEIKPLTLDQARAAIVEPAGLTDGFATPPFEYEPGFLNDILQYLGRDKDNYIESFQIQIICQYVESQVGKNKLSVVKRGDIGSLENIFLGFYSQSLERIGGKAQQSIAQKLVEEGLIFRTGDLGGIRLNLFREQMAQQFPNLEPASLQALLDSRLLREEPDGSGRMRYEIAHDTLVAPILMSRGKREKDLAEQNEQARQEAWKLETNRRKDVEFGKSGLSIRWEFFEQAVGEGKAVLILGDDALADSGQQSIPAQLASFLKVKEQLYTFYAEDQLFWFRSPGERMQVFYELIDFYRQHQLPAFYANTLAQLPFSMILSLNASDLLANAYQRTGRPFTYGFYNRSIPNNVLPPGQKNVPLLYNLMGNLADDESLLLSYSDVYKHLYGLLGNNPLPFEVRKRLADARLILLAGLDFRRSYLLPVLWELLYNKTATRYIVKGETLSDEELRAAAVLGLDALPKDFFVFTEELLNRPGLRTPIPEVTERLEPSRGVPPATDEKQIPPPLPPKINPPDTLPPAAEIVPPPSVDKKPERVDEYVKYRLKSQVEHALNNSRIDEAIQLLREFAPENKELIQLQGRFNELNRSFRSSTISREESELSRHRIVNALIDILKTL